MNLQNHKQQEINFNKETNSIQSKSTKIGFFKSYSKTKSGEV